ncbi:MAG: PilC/PilY family type IV pilus protein, partial [Desulfobacterales bacterium]|nr:PilC/PilY family type IV pilus protein [Desulfobacterales bacterium]
PHGTLNIVINRAHYYTQNTNGTFLVNINGSIKYYRYVDDGDAIVESNELTLLTPTEAAAAGIVTGRTYTQERQNFANWYSFYRRRELTAKNAISKVISDMQGVYIGLLSIHYGDSYGGIRQPAVPVRVTIDDVLQDQSTSLLTTLFTMDSNGGTPLRVGLNNIGNYFRGAYGKPSPLPSTNFSDNSYPFFIADKGGACQQAFTIVMTDGYWNEEFPDNDSTDPLIKNGVGNADGDHNTAFDGSPFGDTASNTLADVAMHYYEQDLKPYVSATNPGLNNDVPINAKDQADHQHLVTYTLAFGVEGSVDQDAYPDCPLGPCPTWPTPVANQLTTVDDLYHAAINGRGRYVNASTPQEMVDAMNELKQDIESRLGSSASLATSSIQRLVGTMIYQGTYNTAGWFGEVNALEVNVETGAVSDPVWRASQHVPAWGSRKILSYNGSSGILFEFNNISEAQETLLANRGHEPAQLVDFIRGDTSNNVSFGGPFRVRTQPIGDIIHSAPTYYKGMIYIGANDGMLHAVNASNGNEVFCYVPGLVYDHLSDLAVPGYSHKYYVDGSAAVGDVDGSDILVCGLGKGGKGYFALDVTDPAAMSEDDVLWEYPPSTDNDMGYSFSQAIIANTEAAGKVVIFGNGYDSVGQKAVLYVLDPEDGTVIRKLDTLVAGCNGLATPKVVDVEGDGYADFAFAGDLKGNMWKFDLRGASAGWKVYYQEGSAPRPLISVRNADNNIQAITAAPEVMLDCAKSTFSRSGAGLMVIFGTGQYLNSSDFGDTSTQSFYGIWDWGDIWEEKAGYSVAQTKYLGVLGTDRSVTNISGTSLQGQTVVSDSSDWVVLSDNPVDWYNPEDTEHPGIHMGWFFDLPALGERGIREPALRMGVAVLISTIPSESPCEAGGSSVLYMVSACTGGQLDEPQFDLNNDDDFDEDDLIDEVPPTGKKFDEILFEGIEISDTLYFSSSQAEIPSEDVPPNLVGLQFWRVIQ